MPHDAKDAVQLELPLNDRPPATMVQLPPTSCARSEVIMDQVLHHIMHHGRGPTVDEIVADIKARSNVGLKKYGTRLMTFNGRDPWVDLYQELLDAVQYHTQAVVEDNAKPRRFLVQDQMAFKLVDLLISVRGEINERAKRSL